jgi:aminoglycoside N3'-acetyltransferase
MRLDCDLRKEGIVKLGRIGMAHSRLVDAMRLIDFCLPRLKENPYLLVSSVPPIS